MSFLTNEEPFFFYDNKSNDSKDDYFNFKFENMIQISNNEVIFAFKCQIIYGTRKEYIYNEDEFYNDETIYYYLNIEKDSSIKNVIGRTKEDSYLFKNKNDEQFYFIYNTSNHNVLRLKDFFEEKKLKLIAINVSDKLNIRNLYIEKHNIIGWDKYSIYLGNIINDKLEIISDINYPDDEYIKYISVKYKHIYYKNKKEDDSNNGIEIIEI